MKRVNIDALRALTALSDSEMEQKLSALLQQSGNDDLAGKINADTIGKLKRQLSAMSQTQLDNLLSAMPDTDMTALQKLRNPRHK